MQEELNVTPEAKDYIACVCRNRCISPISAPSHIASMKTATADNTWLQMIAVLTLNVNADMNSHTAAKAFIQLGILFDQKS